MSTPSFIARAYDEWVHHQEARSPYSAARDTFRVSDLGTCHRRMILKRSGQSGRPMRVEKRRFFRHRILPHDDIVRGLYWSGHVVAQEFDVSPGLPAGFSGHADLLLHNADECCGRTAKGNLRIRWGQALRMIHIGEPESALYPLLEELAEHSYVLCDVKTANPNIVNYSDSLPRSHNVAQLTGYLMGLKRMLCDEYIHWDISARLIYVPMGEGQLLECDVPPRWLDTAREMQQLTHEWDDYPLDVGLEPQLPDVLPLATTDKRDGPHKIVFRVSPWQCSDQYCEYCEYEDQSEPDSFCCRPNRPSVKSGERIAYREQDGSVTYVRKWLDKIGLPLPEGASVEDGPRPKPKKEPA